MNREIKFRFWTPDKRMIEDHNGWCEDIGINEAIRYSKEYGYKIMQFTGLKDKNGKEIFEGDILRYSDGTDVSHHRIYWDERQARWFDERLEDGDSSTNYDDFEFVKDCRIVGNIYEHGHLISGK